MGFFDAMGALFALTALFAYLNYQYVRLPTPIGVMLAGLLLSLGLLLVGGPAEAWAQELVASVPFEEVLMQGMLAFLLFAGALHVNLEDLRRRWVSILTLATLGVLVSTFVVGTGVYYLAAWLGLELPYVHALLFGALISPTDPIAVLGLLKRAGVPKDLEVLISGESLFNDGVGVVVFAVILSLVQTGGHGAEASAAAVAAFFAQEALGGLALGLGLGLVAFYMLRRTDDYSVEVLITLALVSGGYALAANLHTSGPLAMVVAGLLIGNHGRALAMSERTREHLDTFWEMTDEILNALLFVLIGLEVLLVRYTPGYLELAALSVPLVLAARFLSVGLPIGALRLVRPFAGYTVRLMTWGGLRGGISVALALGLPPGPERELILAMTYGVVVFSVLVQGLTIGRLARFAAGR
ncbi:cation:proton antiporter [Oceanithermus desulfurans]|uniref:Na(+)/H(+) antiporter NhaP n=2 Tax=Oceanithermus desulfurans TaxID=227924 RepID=A0A511RNI2_9DEIN|nr:sodium:proton antiporter [Oceanithermus desulfurans]MBB6030705.1 CPA1 family monovalent cation:H+ antiporter [Oceanithermus desulfurans]GEM90366.1 Na(+)/H(+) antiporter NhaP [Oceanithermus desulfurans NBRC 100063]